MLRTFQVGELQTNCYILYNLKECIIIDYGYPDQKVIDFLNNSNINPVIVLATHGHFDHIGGMNQLKELYPNIKVYGPKNDETWFSDDYSINWTNNKVNVDYWYENDEIISLDDKIKLKVIKTPGHTNGSSCLLYNNYLFSGDTLFKTSIGRTDLPFGNTNKIVKSIRSLYDKLNDKIEVLPGHGDKTSIGFEKLYNYFVRK